MIPMRGTERFLKFNFYIWCIISACRNTFNSQKNLRKNRCTNRVLLYIQTFYNLNRRTHTHTLFFLSFIQSSLVVQLILLLPSFSTQMINAHALLLFPLFHLIAHSLLQDHIKLEPIPYVMIWKHY